MGEDLRERLHGAKIAVPTLPYEETAFRRLHGLRSYRKI